MEKVRTALYAFSLITLLSCSVASSQSSRRDFMQLNRAEDKWGQKKFDKALFKSGNEAARAAMVVDMIKSGVYKQKLLRQVIKELGDPTGYYENDGIPAYLLTPESDKKTDIKDDVWQVVFIPDKSWKKVEEVKIHKNCCY